ncbi:MAG: hypothetical protein ACTHJR_03940 [Sphingomonas sp.]|uniref:hypothetical protein n=1 Tax=Sphingomonas sp. TaxID=28214 RepID=UPI003F7DD6A5
MLSMTIDADGVLAGMEAMPSQVTAAVVTRMAELTTELQRHVIDDKLQGQLLHQRSGRLAAAIERSQRINGDIVEGEVFVAGDVPYAAILEHGGSTPPHEIVPDKAKALAFVAGGKHVFARVIHHPGSTFPARPYLESALADQAAEISASLKSAALEAAAKAAGQ